MLCAEVIVATCGYVNLAHCVQWFSMQCLILMGFHYGIEVAYILIGCCFQELCRCSGIAASMEADTVGVAVMQVQANVQTVLEALGLVENKTAKQDAAALKEVSLHHACQWHAVT